nr:hypothetical protein [uncultured Capnocytophaga sp.]
MQNKYNKEQFEELVTKFMFYMDLVFHSDWEHSKGCLENMNWFISEEGNFLYPKVQNEESNWENRGKLLKTYRELDKFLQKHDIRNREIDKYFSEEQDDNEKTDFILLAEKYFDEENEYPEQSIRSLQYFFEKGYKLTVEDKEFIQKSYKIYVQEDEKKLDKWSLLRCIEKLDNLEEIVLALKKAKILFVILSLKFDKPIHFKFPNLLGVMNNAIERYKEDVEIMLKAIKVYDREEEISKLDAKKGVFKHKIESYQKDKPIQDRSFVTIAEIIFPELKL